MNSHIFLVLMCTTITYGAIFRLKRPFFVRSIKKTNNYSPMINTNLPLLKNSNCLQASSSPKTHTVPVLSVKKCCKIGLFFDKNVNKCIPIPTTDATNVLKIDVIYDFNNKPNGKHKKVEYDQVQVTNVKIEILKTFGSLKLYKSDTIVVSSGELLLNQDGILLDIEENCSVFKHSVYCLDTDEAGKVLAIVRESIFNAKNFVLMPCMVVSIVFLILLIINYYEVPQLKDLFGKALICLSFCLLAQNTCYTINCSKFFKESLMDKFKDCLFICCAYWYLIMCIDLCSHTWFYLPKGERMERHSERKIFYILLIIFFIMTTVMILSTFNPAPWVPVITLVVLLICGGTFCATLYAFKKLRKKIELAYITSRNHESRDDGKINLLTFNQESISKAKNMFSNTSFLLGYAAICFVIKYARHHQNIKMSAMYELFYSLSGVFMFVVFTCWGRPKEIIFDYWKRKNNLTDTAIELMSKN